MAEKLSKSPVWVSLAVKDMGKARKFYEDVLGFEPMMSMESDETTLFKGAEGTGILLYKSEENAGTNKATAACWKIDDLDDVMTDLKAAGVEFEEYDQPGLKTENGVVTWEEGGKTAKGAWFKDPDGNILNITEM